MPEVQEQIERERLAKVAEALDTLAKYAYLYGGPRTRSRRIVEVKAFFPYFSRLFLKAETFKY